MILYYDNHCQNCTQFIHLIKKLDLFRLLERRQLRNPEHIHNAKGIDKTLAKKQMASFDGNWHYGYATLFKIFLRIPLSWPIIPILWILKISTIGQYLYLQLAVNRKIIPVHCTEDSCELK